MTDRRADRLAEFIEPLRVRPGSKVDLARDFDPGYKAGFLRKKDGAELLRAGVELLADYQARLAAQDTYGVLVCLQALGAGGKQPADRTRRHCWTAPARLVNTFHALLHDLVAERYFLSETHQSACNRTPNTCSCLLVAVCGFQRTEQPAMVTR